MKNNPKELVDDLKVIRTIHSNKARKFANLNFVYLIITVVVAVVVTIIGFSGPENIASFLELTSDQANQNASSNDSIVRNGVSLVVNLMTLSILVISILGLIFKFEGKMNKHNSAVVRLTEFIADIEIQYLSINPSTIVAFKPEDLRPYSERYKSLINSLPPTKDKDYYKALSTIKKKKKIKNFIMSEEYYSKSAFGRWWFLKWL